MLQNEVLSELKKQFKEFENKSSLIPYYMNFQFPQKQEKLINWWQKVLKSYLIKSKKLSFNLNQLEKFFFIYGVKPTPLKNLLVHFIQHKILQFSKQIQQPTKTTMFQSFKSYFITTPKMSNITIDPFTKIYVTEMLSQSIRKLIKVLKQIFNDDNAINYEFFKRKIKQHLNIAEDIEYLLQKVINEGYIKIDKVQNIEVVLYSNNLNQLQEPIWVQMQKTKYNLKSKIEFFKNKIDKVIQNLDQLQKKARSHLQNGQKERAKAVLKQKTHIDQQLLNLTLRRDALNKVFQQLKSHEMDSISIDLIKNSQSIIKQNMIDPSILDQIYQQDRNIQFSQNQIKQHFINQRQQDSESVDQMMRQLEMEVKKEKMINHQAYVKQKEYIEKNKNKMDIEQLPMGKQKMKVSQNQIY